MRTQFQQHPDGLVYVRTDAGEYVDTSSNFETDFGQPLPALPAGARERLYIPDVRHVLSGADGAVMGGERVWPFGNAAITGYATLVAAQVARLAAIPVPPPVDQSDLDNLEKNLKALAMTFAQITGTPLATVRTIFKQKRDSLA